MPLTQSDLAPYDSVPKSAGMERRLDHKLYQLEQQMEDVEKRRQDLNRLLIESENRYKPLRRDATSEQVQAHQEAQVASQNRIAEMQAELDLKTAEIQNRLDEALAEIDNHFAMQQAQLEAQRRLETTRYKIEARTQTARIKAQAGMGQANESKPILYQGVSYSQANRPEQEAANDSTADEQSSADSQVTSRPAAPPGESRPDFPEQLAPAVANKDKVTVVNGENLRIKYDAVLVYHEQETRDIWAEYLRAYGEDSLFKSHNPDNGEYFIYLGTYNRPGDAQTRLSNIEETIGSSVNSRVVTRDLSQS